MRRAAILFLNAIFLTALAVAADPWKQSDLIQPEQLAPDLKSPLILHTGFPVLYRSAHIPNSQFAGQGSKAEGIEELKKLVANQPRDRRIVIYCGCCPWTDCPNIRPAFAALRQMGFTHVQALVIPTNLKADWIDKGFPIEKRQ